MPVVTLCPVTVENWQACIDLATTAEQQDFVASNLYSIAEAQFYPTMKARAVINQDETIVGFVFYGFSPRAAQYKVVRLMIDHHYQGQGYGRAAMEAVISDLMATNAAREVWLSYREGNTQARQLYQSLGFQEHSIESNGRITASRSLNAVFASAQSSQHRE